MLLSLAIFATRSRFSGDILSNGSSGKPLLAGRFGGGGPLHRADPLFHHRAAALRLVGTRPPCVTASSIAAA